MLIFVSLFRYMMMNNGTTFYQHSTFPHHAAMLHSLSAPFMSSKYHFISDLRNFDIFTGTASKEHALTAINNLKLHNLHRELWFCSSVVHRIFWSYQNVSSPISPSVSSSICHTLLNFSYNSVQWRLSVTHLLQFPVITHVMTILLWRFGVFI